MYVLFSNLPYARDILYMITFANSAKVRQSSQNMKIIACLTSICRCARYDNIPDTCTMVTDPRDSCCLVPQCPPTPKVTPSPVPGVSTTTYVIPTAPPGEVTGAANVPTPGPGQTPQPISESKHHTQKMNSKNLLHF